MLSVTWIRGIVTRRSGRLIGTATGVAIAVALLASIGTFLAGSKATMTRRAVQNVTVDWQVEAQPGADPKAVLTGVTTRAKAALPVEFATTTGLQATTGASTQTTGPGVVVGLPDTYRTAFPGVIRDLAGARSGVLVAQQTAANLHVAPGDSVSIGRAGLTSVVLRIDGVIDLPHADSFFQKVGAPIGAQPQAPPDNVLLVPAATWHAQFDALGATRPDQITHQVHARISHALPGDPAAAYTRVTGAARNLEVSLTGTALVGDNLGATLSAARGDALYAQVLFLFLGVPGAVLAGLLTAAVAASGSDRRRREQALLRTRGAATTTLVRLALIEAALVGGVGALLGLGTAALVGRMAFDTAAFGATTTAAIVWTIGAAIVGLAISGLAIALPAWRDARTVTVIGARRVIGRARAPRWLRFGLDLLLLGGSGLVFWLTSRNGYQLVLAPEGTPAISVSYWALAGPALLWAGAGLLAWRVAYLLLGTGPAITREIARRFARPFSGRLAGTVGATMSRQRRLLAGALALVALTTAFAASTAVFNSTYQAQAEVDARLSNGANVTVTEPPGSNVAPAVGQQLRSIPGVTSVEPLQHRYAYVGADLQDLFGVRTSTIVDATKLQDAYFHGGTARGLIARLGERSDGIIVSAETVKDFQLHPGDTLRLRLQNGRTKQLTEVPFHYIGVATEFPTAPRDSFMLANATYIARATGSPAVGAFLLDTSGPSPAAVAAAVRTRVGTSATVTDITSLRKVIGSSLTAVDLSGLTRVELGFAIALAAAATGLVLALGFAERRRTFAIATALGAKPRQLGGFVWSEAAFVTAGGLIAGALTGWALAEMLVKVLTGVFDPAPAALSVPWAYLIVVAGVSIGAVIVAALVTIRRAQRAPVTVLREL